MAKMAAKAKQSREKKQAEEHQKQEEEQPAKQAEEEKTDQAEEEKTDQPKSRKRTIDEAEEEEGVGTSGVSKEVAEITTPPHPEDNRPKKRVLVAKDLAAIPVPAPSPIRKTSVPPSPTVCVRRKRKAARTWKSIVYFDFAVVGLLAAAWTGVAYLAKAKDRQQ
jgi:hypothetical protein